MSNAVLAAPADDNNQTPAGPVQAVRQANGYTIETGHEPPAGLTSGRAKYPFRELKLGESVVITGVHKATLSGALTSWRTRKDPVNLMMWPEGAGFRVKRIG